MITIVLPKQPNESTEIFGERIKADAVNYAEDRKKFFQNEKCREKKKTVLNSMTGLAIWEIALSHESICCECGKVEEKEPMNCYECGSVDFIEVHNIEGEYYVTGEEYLLKAKNVRM